jgi:curved DNA-binding protein CbpA
MGPAVEDVPKYVKRPSPDYYSVLGLSREATLVEIKRAYRRLARTCHPDLNPNDAEGEERFKRITEAYEVLRDPLLRADYDGGGRAPFTRPRAHPAADSIYNDDFLQLLHLFRVHKLGDQMPNARRGHGPKEPRR